MSSPIGSDPGRAAERTALAWRRNGLSLASAGVAIAKGVPAHRVVEGRPLLGGLVVALGVVSFAVSSRQATRRARHAGLGRPTAELADLWPVTASTMLIAVAAIVMVLVPR